MLKTREISKEKYICKKEKNGKYNNFPIFNFLGVYSNSIRYILTIITRSYNILARHQINVQLRMTSTIVHDTKNYKNS